MAVVHISHKSTDVMLLGNIGNFNQKWSVVFFGKKQFSNLQASNAFLGSIFVV